MDAKDELSAEEKEKLRLFKVAAGDAIQPHHDDFYLITWLRARNLNLQKAEDMFRASMSWRKKMNIDTILNTWEPPEVLKKYFPWSYLGFSKTGYPVLLLTFGTCDFRGLLQSATEEECILWITYQFELCHKKIKEQAAQLGINVLKFIILSDMKNLEYRQLFFKATMQLLIHAILVYEANYPETLKAVYGINAPKFFTIAFATLKTFMADATVGKIQLFDSNEAAWKPVLLNSIGKDILPKHWGGLRIDPDGDEFCPSVVNRGGEVPKLYYKDRRIRLKSQSNVKRETISRKSQLRLKFVTEKLNSVLRWQYMTDAYDIGFGIQFENKHGEVTDMIFPERHNCSSDIIEGQIVCNQIGTYIVIFDNTYSTWHSKSLSYNIQILPAT